MGLFRKRKRKRPPDDIRATKRRYITLRSQIQENPHKYSQSDIERLLHYENELREAGIDIEENFGSPIQHQLSAASPPVHPSPTMPTAQFNPPGYPGQPAQMIPQDAGMTQTVKKQTGFGKLDFSKPFVTDQTDLNIVTGEETNTSNKVITVCGKTVAIDQIAGRCSVCGEAVCHMHEVYCAGYQNVPCTQLLCPRHIQYFKDPDGKRVPCCPDHYNMRYYYQE